MTLPETQPTPATDPKADPQGSYEVLVIGAGQAGLTLGYYLRQAGVRFLIVDAADQVGSAWAQRWDSLVLFTPRRYNAMPGLSFNGDLDQEPTRDEVIDYLHRYATEFDLPIQLNSTVTALHHADGRYVAELATGTIQADQVVVATGPFQRPRVPDFASSVASDVYQIHSSGYRRPSDLPPGRVVVVGGGNTGYQIAEELAADHRCRPRGGLTAASAAATAARAADLLVAHQARMQRITIDSRLGRRLRERETLIGSSPAKAKRQGITLKPRALEASGRVVRFADGTSVEADAIIWATGYRVRLLLDPTPIVDEQGRLRHRRGVTDQPGLYFLGLQWQHTRGSALLGLRQRRRPIHRPAHHCQQESKPSQPLIHGNVPPPERFSGPRIASQLVRRQARLLGTLLVLIIAGLAADLFAQRGFESAAAATPIAADTAKVSRASGSYQRGETKHVVEPTLRQPQAPAWRAESGPACVFPLMTIPGETRGPSWPDLQTATVLSMPKP